MIYIWCLERVTYKEWCPFWIYSQTIWRHKIQVRNQDLHISTMTSIVKLTVHTELFLLVLNDIFETCSRRPVRYFGMISQNFGMKIYYYFLFLTGNLRKKNLILKSWFPDLYSILQSKKTWSSRKPQSNIDFLISL